MWEKYQITCFDLVNLLSRYGHVGVHRFFVFLEISLLNSVYNQMILKPKQFLGLESVYVEKDIICVANGLRKVAEFSSSADIVIRETQAAQRGPPWLE